MDQTPPPLEEVLGKLPWFGELTAAHRHELVSEVHGRLSMDTSHNQCAVLLEHWADVAHADVKRGRLELLRESGLLAS